MEGEATEAAQPRQVLYKTRIQPSRARLFIQEHKHLFYTGLLVTFLLFLFSVLFATLLPVEPKFVKVFEVSYDKEFHSDLLDPTTERFKIEQKAVLKDLNKLIPKQLANTAGDEASSSVEITVDGFRNGSTVVLFEVNSIQLDASTIEKAVVAIATDEEASIANAPVLEVHVAILSIAELPVNRVIQIQLADDEEMFDYVTSPETTEASESSLEGSTTAGTTKGTTSHQTTKETSTTPEPTTTYPVTTVTTTEQTTTTQRLPIQELLAARDPDPVHYNWTGPDLSWQGAKQFCAEHSRILCSAHEICGSGTPIFTGKYPEERWAPTNDIPNDWIQIGQHEKYTVCVEHVVIDMTFPSWGLTNENPATKKDVFCCAPETHNVTYCRQVDKAYIWWVDRSRRTEVHEIGDRWTMPSGTWCRCAADGFTECHMPQQCFGGYNMDQYFCLGQFRPYAVNCAFPSVARDPPGLWTSHPNIRTLGSYECAECEEKGCLIWDTEWTGWSEWSSCTVSCGAGLRRRLKICPEGRKCFGLDFTTESCENECEDMDVPPDSWSEDVLWWHNYYRRGHDSPPLTWDRALAATSQKYVDYVMDTNTTVINHSTQGYYPNGEVYRINHVSEMLTYSKQPYDVPGDEWFDGYQSTYGKYAEVRYYDWLNPGSKKSGYPGNYVVGHFTQLLWKSTERMGCGVGRSDTPHDGGNYVFLVVCHYTPVGNTANEYYEWAAEVPEYNKDLICEAECGTDKCWSFSGLEPNGTASSCDCAKSDAEPVCGAPCMVFCPFAEHLDMCSGKQECHCEGTWSAVCDGVPTQ